MTDAELAERGFELVQRRRGVRRYARRVHAYLVYWLNASDAGHADLTWEFELGQYLHDRGFAVSGQDEVSLLMFPSSELHADFDAAGVDGLVARADASLSALDFAGGA